MKIKFIFIIGLISVSCQTTKPEKTSIEKQKITSQKSSPIVISNLNNIDWKKFFKPAPNLKQKKLIEQNLKEIQNKKKLSVADLLKLGRNELAIGNIVNAEINFRKALKTNENNIEILLELAGLYLRQHKLNQTFKYLNIIKKLLKDNNDNKNEVMFKYRFILAISYIERGEIKAGHNILGDLIEIDNKFIPAYSALASSYLKLGKLKIAEFIAKRGLDLGKDEESLYNILGVVAQQKYQITVAMKYFNKALSLNQNYSPSLINRANLNINQNEYEPAEKDLLAAIKNSPSNYQAYISLGICQKKMGLIDSAKASLLKALDLFPGSADARYNLGILMAEDFNKPNVALRYFNEVLQITKSSEKIKSLAKLYIENIRENRKL